MRAINDYITLRSCVMSNATPGKCVYVNCRQNKIETRHDVEMARAREKCVGARRRVANPRRVTFSAATRNLCVRAKVNQCINK